MKTTLSRTLLALSTLLCLGSTGLADGFMRQPTYITDQGMRQLAYMPETYEDEQELPAAYAGQQHEEVYGDSGCCPGHKAHGGYCGDSYDCGKAYCGNGYCGNGYCGNGYCGDNGYWGNGYGCSDGCGGRCGCPPPGRGQHHGRHGGHQPPGMCYAEVQNTFLRAHVSEQVVGKLSETYEYSPRYIVGYEVPSGLGARARYWRYDETTENLQIPQNSLRLEFDVVDGEFTHRLRSSRGDLVVAGGVRWARIVAGTRDLQPTTAQRGPDVLARGDMLGLTFAADARSVVCCHGRCEWAVVGGGRWSILGGDWIGQANQVIQPFRDDNVVVKELYAGVECLRAGHSYNFYARAAFEMQNWHSDAMNRANNGTIGFLGPAVHAGVTF